MSDLEKIGALWLRKSSKTGKVFMTGMVCGKSIIVFKNNRKQDGDKQPDYEVFRGQDRESLPPKDDQGDAAPF